MIGFLANVPIIEPLAETDGEDMAPLSPFFYDDDDQVDEELAEEETNNEETNENECKFQLYSYSGCIFTFLL